MKDKLTNMIEVFNEISILLCAYMMMTFKVSNNGDFLTMLSWVFIGTTCFNMLVNITIMIVDIVIQMIKLRRE